jgi:hypothetical protein
MYKWHVHSAIGRGRPVAGDISRVADGVAASLRQFSISISRTAESEGTLHLDVQLELECHEILTTYTDKPSTSRAERSANAAREVSSLASTAPPRGIDARSLAAKPPQAFKIRRIEVNSGPIVPGRGGFSRQRGTGPGARGGRGGHEIGAWRGRGAARGRGRSRGRGGRRSRGRARDREDDSDEPQPPPPMNKEELAWFDAFESGFELPYNPTTNLEHLRRQGASTMPPSSPMGVVESVAHKFQIATGALSPANFHAAIHLKRINRGDGSSFEDQDAKALAQAYYDHLRQADADKSADSEGKERKKLESRPLPTVDALPEDFRSEVAKVWVAGHYNGPKYADKGDILGLTETYAKLNETYLPHSAQSFKEKLKSLLPAAYQKHEAENVQQPERGRKPL